MADLVIRGMEMPTVCIDNGWYGNCPMDRSWCAQRFAPKDSTNGSAHKDQWNKLPSWCPLLPLPEGHGDLVERKALNLFPDYKEVRNRIKQTIKATERDKRTTTGVTIDFLKQTFAALDSLRSVRRYFLDAKTIVPAEGGADNGS